MIKKNSQKLEIYILSGLIVLLSLYIFLRGDENLNYKIPSVELETLQNLQSITYNNFTIENKEESWVLPNGYSVSDNVLDTIDRKLKNFQVIDKISDRDNEERFGMDNPQNLELKSINGDTTNLIIGSLSSSGSYTYVKIPNQSGVFSVRGDITQLLSSNIDELRSKTVLKTDNISKIIVTKNETEIVKDGESLKDLTFLENIKANSFKDLIREEQLLTLSVIDEKGEKSMIIYKEQNGEYPATSSEVDFPFTLTKYTVDKLLDIE